MEIGESFIWFQSEGEIFKYILKLEILKEKNDRFD